jgi:hypothetical protein
LLRWHLPRLQPHRFLRRISRKRPVRSSRQWTVPARRTLQIMAWMTDAANAQAAQKLIGKYAPANAPLGTEDLVIEIEGHSKHGAPETGIIERLMEHT